MNLQESSFLTSDYTTKLQSSRGYGTDTKTELQTNGTRQKVLRLNPHTQGQLNFNSVQLLSHVQFFVTPWTTACQASLPITNSQSLLKLMSIESVTKSAIQPSHPLSPASIHASVFPIIRVFSKESVLHIRWPKYWSFSFSISTSNEHSGLVSFRIRLDLLAVQGTLKNLLQHFSSKA